LHGEHRHGASGEREGQRYNEKELLHDGSPKRRSARSTADGSQQPHRRFNRAAKNERRLAPVMSKPPRFPRFMLNAMAQERMRHFDLEQQIYSGDVTYPVEPHVGGLRTEGDRLSASLSVPVAELFFLGRARRVPRYSVQVFVRTVDQKPKPLAVERNRFGSKSYKACSAYPACCDSGERAATKISTRSQIPSPDYFGVSNTACSLPLALLASHRI
jgi:hypothetical protein